MNIYYYLEVIKNKINYLFQSNKLQKIREAYIIAKNFGLLEYFKCVFKKYKGVQYYNSDNSKLHVLFLDTKIMFSIEGNYIRGIKITDSNTKKGYITNVSKVSTNLNDILDICQNWYYNLIINE